ncbi:unnamed protein product [Polarella glacialis]|uniref:Uncharacterized protein n=1 Tax=Polarella glacialis TaxID=89957 RepID=A0A813KRK3_POLGL|nr:unnamed protein product [Polarella glacialis]
MVGASAASRSGILIHGRPLLSMNEASSFWQDSALLDIKSWADDVYWSAAAALPNTATTLQMRALQRSYFQHGQGGAAGPVTGPWAECRICLVVYELLRFCGGSLTLQPSTEVWERRMGQLVDFFESTDLGDIVMEGWGYAFSKVGLYCSGVAQKLGPGYHPQTELSEPEAERRMFCSSLFTYSMNVGVPQHFKSLEALAPNYDGAWEVMLTAERKLKQQLGDRALSASTWWLMLCEFWIPQLAAITSFWNAAGARYSVSPSRCGASAHFQRDHALDRISRASGGNWGGAIVAAKLAPMDDVPDAAEEVELMVVLQRLDDHEVIRKQAASTRAFKYALPEEAIFGLRALATWRGCQAGPGGRDSESCQVACRVRSQSSVYTGCRGSSCAGQADEHVSSLRVNCGIPWSLPLAAGTHTAAVLHLQGEGEKGPNLRIPFRMTSRERTKPGGVAVCVMPVFGYAAIEKRWGDLIGSWLHYHLSLLEGIDRVHLYDIDGSLLPAQKAAADAGRPWPAAVVFYEPHFSGRIFHGGLRNMSQTRDCPYCAESLAYDHCLINSRNRADHLLVIHGLDEWLVPAPGSGLNLGTYLDALPYFCWTMFLRQQALHHRGQGQGDDKDLIQSSTLASPENWTSSSWIWRNRIFPNLVVQHPGHASYIDTHIVSQMPRQSFLSMLHAPRQKMKAIRGWTVNHHVDFMSKRIWIPNAGYHSGEGEPAIQLVKDTALLDLIGRLTVSSQKARDTEPD